MKRFHVHVDDLGKSIDSYSKLFAAQPARVSLRQQLHGIGKR